MTNRAFAKINCGCNVKTCHHEYKISTKSPILPNSRSIPGKPNNKNGVPVI